MSKEPESAAPAGVELSDIVVCTVAAARSREIHAGHHLPSLDVLLERLTGQKKAECRAAINHAQKRGLVVQISSADAWVNTKGKVFLDYCVNEHPAIPDHVMKATCPPDEPLRLLLKCTDSHREWIREGTLRAIREHVFDEPRDLAMDDCNEAIIDLLDDLEALDRNVHLDAAARLRQPISGMLDIDDAIRRKRAEDLVQSIVAGLVSNPALADAEPEYIVNRSLKIAQAVLDEDDPGMCDLLGKPSSF